MDRRSGVTLGGSDVAGLASSAGGEAVIGWGALGATDEAAVFYRARGWKLWQGTSSALTPNGIRRTENEDGCIYVLPSAVPLDLTSEVTCDWRDGGVW